MKYISILLAALLLASCSMSPTETTLMSTSSGSFVEVINATSPKIIQTKEFESCMAPTVNMCIKQVANDIARTDGSVSFCDELKDEKSRESCKFGVIIRQLDESNDINLCDTLSEELKHECRIVILTKEATESWDIEKCDLLQQEFPTQSGAKVETNERVDLCRMALIMQNSDAVVWDCDVLDNSGQKNTCISMIRNRYDPSVPVRNNNRN